MSCGAETEANTLFTALLAGEDVALPAIDFADLDIPTGLLDAVLVPVTRLANDDLTTGAISGSGTFDVLMRGFKAHLKEEFDKGRITGTEYTKAYIALTESAMAQGVNFLINRDQSYWQAVTAQLGALQARTVLKTAQMQLVTAKFEALTAKSNFGLTKMKISSESMAYCVAKYGLENMLPKQANLVQAQVDQQLVETQISEYNLSDMLPNQKAQLLQQVENLTTEGEVAQYTLNNMLPTQKKLIEEQMEAQRGQTLDTRSDGVTPIVGSIGKQKNLYDQQIVSYQRDAEIKAMKSWTDAWTVMKTVDEGLAPPTAYANTNLNQILQTIATNNGFGDLTL